MIKSQAKCKHCGSTRVSWHQAKSGRWVLMNLSREYDNGQSYLRGPHYQTCPGEKPEQAEERVQARNARLMTRALELLSQGVPADDALTQARKEADQ